MLPDKKDWFSSVLRFFFPPKCAACKTCGFEGLCPACKERVEEDYFPKRYLASGGNGFADGMLSLFPYESESVLPLLFEWKRENYNDLPGIFGEYVARAAKETEYFREIDLVTFAPRRRWARFSAGFDQAEELAKEISRRLEIPLETLLARRGFSLAQHRMRGEQRERNVHGVFRPLRSLEGETVLLVDDIVTTGASVKECARVLKQCGAMKVFVFSLAH